MQDGGDVQLTAADARLWQTVTSIAHSPSAAVGNKVELPLMRATHGLGQCLCSVINDEW